MGPVRCSVHTCGDWSHRAAAGQYSAREAIEIDGEGRFALEGILPRTGASIFFGPGSTGKTQFLLWLACHLASSGEGAPSHLLDAAINRRGHILIISAEDLREEIFSRIRGIAHRMRLENPNVDVQEICSRLHVIPFLSLTTTEFSDLSPALFAREKDGKWRATETLSKIEEFISSWNAQMDDLDRDEDKIIGVVMDSAVSMAGFELVNSEATTNFLFRINRQSRKQDVFWAIIGHTPKEPKSTDPRDGVARLRGSAMWSTTPRAVIELRIAGPDEILDNIREAYPGLRDRDVVIATTVKANSRAADLRPRVLRRLQEGAYEDLTERFPEVCAAYADDQPGDEKARDLAATLALIKAVGAQTGSSKVHRKDLEESFRSMRTRIPGLHSMKPIADGNSTRTARSLAAAIKDLKDSGQIAYSDRGQVIAIIGKDAP